LKKLPPTNLINLFVSGYIAKPEEIITAALPADIVEAVANVCIV
jgi:hypothetical protein